MPTIRCQLEPTHPCTVEDGRSEGKTSSSPCYTPPMCVVNVPHDMVSFVVPIFDVDVTGTCGHHFLKCRSYKRSKSSEPPNLNFNQLPLVQLNSAAPLRELVKFFFRPGEADGENLKKNGGCSMCMKILCL